MVWERSVFFLVWNLFVEYELNIEGIGWSFIRGKIKILIYVDIIMSNNLMIEYLKYNFNLIVF